MTHATTQLQPFASGRSIAGAPYTIQPALVVVEHDPALMTPYDLGVLDAEDGELCLPDLYFVKPQQMYDYAIGYSSIKPGSPLAEQIMSQYEQEQYEIARGIEPEYRPVVLDFEIDW